MGWLATSILAIAASFLFATNALADKRIALVIGNSAYQHTPELRNPRNDAADIAAVLKQMKFEVVEGLDLDKRAMEITIRKFSSALKKADVGVFFYAGHGLQVAGQNYLVPIDARLDDAAGLDFEMIRLDLVHRTMERETKTNILFLDACRDNPLSRNLARAMGTRSADIGHGLAPVESGVGTLISFSTQPGNVALDGDGRNSPFASALAKRMATLGEDVSSILINVRNDVMQATNNRQVPWEHSALRSKLYFGDKAGAGDSTAAGKQAEIELASWSAAKASGSVSGLEFYLRQYPHGAFAGSAKLLIDQYRQEEAKRAELAAREAELKRAEEAKQAPALKQAEELRKAEEAKREQELVMARQEMRKAQEAVKAAEEAKLAALKSAEEARKAAEAAVKGASTRDQAEAVKVASLPPPTVDRGTMARLIQTELKRVGCDPGSADGAWGPKAEEALAKFARLANVSLSKEPTTEALQAVAAQKGRICPLVCGAGEVLANDKCVAKAKPEPKPAQQAKRQAAPEAKPSGSGMCFAAGGNSSHAFVPCDHPAASRKAF